MKYTLGIIGTGFMASAIISGALSKNVLGSSAICAYDINKDSLASFCKTGIHPCSSIDELLSSTEIVMMSVKPQNAEEIFQKNDFSKVSAVLSIMAGITLDSMQKMLCLEDIGIARVMPNMPCSIGSGYSGVCFNDKINAQSRSLVLDIFSACGEASVIAEEKFDALTSISGSGPAYVYTFISGLIKGGLEGGLTYEEAKRMAVATVQGAAELVKKSDDDLDCMVKKVCSKGGTTIEAINVFKEKNLEQTIIDGIAACRKRSKELSQ